VLEGLGGVVGGGELLTIFRVIGIGLKGRGGEAHQERARPEVMIKGIFTWLVNE
jgi:hypothetical protein